MKFYTGTSLIHCTVFCLLCFYR